MTKYRVAGCAAFLLGALIVIPAIYAQVPTINNAVPVSVKDAPEVSQTAKRRIFRGVCDARAEVSYADAIAAIYGDNSQQYRIWNSIGLGVLESPGASYHHKPTDVASPQGTACATERAMAGTGEEQGCMRFYNVCVPVEGSPFVYGVIMPDVGGRVTRNVVLLVGMSTQEKEAGLEKVIQDFLKGRTQRR